MMQTVTWSCLITIASLLIVKSTVITKKNLRHDSVYSIDNLNLKRRLAQEPEMLPLFPGYGTHYVYAYIGSPPQRQSLIVDTGSHYTGFPCKGCQTCGEHTDNFFKPGQSSSATNLECDTPSHKCLAAQKYKEGSSWNGYLVKDNFWLGGMEQGTVKGAESYGVNMTFACMVKMEGLFKNQLADGVLGLSMTEDVLPTVLTQAKVSPNRIFCLCFRVGGGILTLGGFDESINETPFQYVKMLPFNNDHFFKVNLREIVVKTFEFEDDQKIDIPASFYNQGQGTIIDSGTTDTYFPIKAKEYFSAILKKAVGIEYTEDVFKLGPKSLAKLPSIFFRMEQFGSTADAPKTVDIEMTWENYLENEGQNEYSFRIFFAEQTGVVLGANFLTGFNTMFSRDELKFGFAKSKCNYEDTLPPPPETSPAVEGCEPGEENVKIAYTDCTASCDRNETAYKSEGTQDWVSKCNPTSSQIEPRPCFENCTFYQIVRGDPQCPDKPWTDCNKACIRSRLVVPTGEPLFVGKGNKKKCNYHQQTSTCYAGMCPIADGDYLVYVDLRVRLEPWKWSYVYTESFYEAMNSLFKLKVDDTELLNDAGNEYSFGTKLHFKIRLKKKDFKDIMSLHNKAESMVLAVRSAGFSRNLINTLDIISKVRDGDQISRFGWLFDQDIEVLSAVALPMGEIRDPYGVLATPDHPEETEMSASSKADLFLLGIAITAVLMLVILLYLHVRLRHEHSLYEKDKGTLSRSGEALRKIWASATSTPVPGSDAEKKEIEMSKTKLMQPIDEDLDEE